MKKVYDCMCLAEEGGQSQSAESHLLEVSATSSQEAKEIAKNWLKDLLSYSGKGHWKVRVLRVG